MMLHFYASGKVLSLLQQEELLFETSALAGTVYTIPANQIKSAQISLFFSALCNEM